MSASLLVRRHASLEDRYRAEDGTVMLTGIQALVRLTLDQRRLDARRGHDTGIFVSGYQGSPLGGLDQELARSRKLLDPAGIVFRPGLNEELAATAVAGTQLLGQLERRRRAAVTGFWFGKSPGLDRAADAIRHGNLSGTAPLGGAVAWIGDDPSAKSSTVPSSCEPICRSLVMPVLASGTVAEILELGLHAVALSRYSGLWCGLKIVADNADASAGVDLSGMLDRVPELGLREGHAAPVLLPPSNLDAEHDQMTLRLERVREYVRHAQLNGLVRDPRRARIAVVGAGTGLQATLRALADLGIDERAAEDVGVRVVRLAMPWPVDRAEIRSLLADVETVLVVEDKLAFVETLVRDALYGAPTRPVVVGKEDADGRPLLSTRSMLGADDVAAALLRLLPGDTLPEAARARIAAGERRVRDVAHERPLPARVPYFCSGCPHNRSTRAEPDQLVGAGIGCHTMVALDDSGDRGTLLGMPQMGGEGAQWLGLEPFTDDEHILQNLGDGTFHHSGSLAIRAAVAAGARITYRLLYNDAVAMTGGQTPQGRLAVPALTRWLALEGVKQVVVTTPEPSSYRRVRLDPIAVVRHRDDLPQVQAELAALPGVTVLIHDDRCATEERRMRKRGQLEAPAERVLINERVCEGCGDCGKKSTCLSVLPVDTEFGRKTQIHQASCNQDLSCLEGDCPSFLLVTPRREASAVGRLWRRLLGRTDDVAAPAAPVATPEPPVVLTVPERRVPDDVLVRMPGVGGTGVVTVSQVLQMAAHVDGRSAAGIEQIGLAQKGGPVTSDLRIASAPIDGQLRATAGSVDVLLGFDLLGAASPGTLEVTDPERTVAVVSTSRTPTAEMVTDPTVRFPAVRRPVARIDRATRRDDNLYLDAQRLAEQLLGDHLPANMLLVGAAYQHGCLPVSAEAIEEAIRLNGAAVAANVAAFRWGRAAAIDLGAVEAAARGATPALAAPVVDPRAATLVAPLGLPATLRSGVERRASELIAFQDLRYAERYVADVGRVAAIEREHAPTPGPAPGHRSAADGEAATGRPEGLPVTRAYAHHLHKLMAYKDEYEIARLHRDPVERARVAATFGPRAKVRVLLHPPLLRALGLRRKLRLGGWVMPLFAVLYRFRGLRGTAWDPFGYAAVRRVERALIDEYRTMIEEALIRLRPGTVAQLVALCELPDMIRGYEHVKLDNVTRYRAQAATQIETLRAATGGAATGSSR